MKVLNKEKPLAMKLSKKFIKRAEELFNLGTYSETIQGFILSLSFPDRLQLIKETENHMLADFIIDNLSPQERKAEDRAIRAVLTARKREKENPKRFSADRVTE